MLYYTSKYTHATKSYLIFYLSIHFFKGIGITGSPALKSPSRKKRIAKRRRKSSFDELEADDATHDFRPISSSSSSEPDDLTVIWTGPGKKVLDDITLEEDDDDVVEASPQPSTTPQELQSLIQKQFQTVKSVMTICQTDYDRAVTLAERLHSIFSSIKCFRTSLFRHTYLQLQDPADISANKILIYCWTSDDNNRPTRAHLSLAEITRLLLADQIPNGPETNDSVQWELSKDEDFERNENVRVIYGHETMETFTFTLVVDPAYMAEVRLCELLRYMCSFDSRALPLLTIVRYWSMTNRIFLGESRVPESKFLTPSPASLDWLVVSWMVKRGFLPSPELIQGRSHVAILVKLDRTNIDVGFSDDTDYVDDWKRKARPFAKEGNGLILSVLKLAQSFFQDSSEMKGGRWLLNTKTGELITMQSIATGRANYSIMMAMRRKTCHWKESLHVDLNTTQFHMFNPFFADGSLHVKNFTPDAFNRICDIMSDTGNRLKDYLRDVQKEVEPRFCLTDCLKSPTTRIPLSEEIQEIKSRRSAPGPSVSISNSTRTSKPGKRVPPAPALPLPPKQYQKIADVMWGDDFKPLQTFPVVLPLTQLQRQFSSIRDEMEIPDDEYIRTLKVAKDLNRIIRETNGSKSRNFFRSSLFRNNFLKLRDPSGLFKNVVLIYCWNWKLLEQKVGREERDELVGEFQPISRDDLWRHIFNPQRQYGLLQGVALNKNLKVQFGCGDTLDLILKQSNGTNLQLSIAFHAGALIEAQLSKLLKYMCTFDSRTIPLITVVRYWAKVNNVLGGTIGTNFPGICIPSPAALDWMVITWMVSQDMVPRPRAILGKPHSHLEIQIEDNHHVDIGFSQDSKLTEKWIRQHNNYPEYGSDDFCRNVVHLAQSFFEEYGGQLRSGNFLLNTRDAEWIKMETFLSVDNFAEVETKLTWMEFESLVNKDFDPDNTISFESTRLHIVNPFTVLSTLHVNNSGDNEKFSRICYVMKQTGKQLGDLVTTLNSGSYNFDLATSLKTSLLTSHARFS